GARQVVLPAFLSGRRRLRTWDWDSAGRSSWWSRKWPCTQRSKLGDWVKHHLSGVRLVFNSREEGNRGSQRTERLSQIRSGLAGSKRRHCESRSSSSRGDSRGPEYSNTA